MSDFVVNAAMSGHQFYTQIQACLAEQSTPDEDLTKMTQAFVEANCTTQNAESMNAAGESFSDWAWIGLLFDQLPEQALWALLKAAVATRAILQDEAVRKLDDRMQGFLFFEPHIQNRQVRIEFVRSPQHMLCLREAAGSRNVWLDDEEFSQLVELDDSKTLACFARCEQMKPHHLVYIERKLAADPHRSEYLADDDEARITLKKATELQGQTRELLSMREAQKIQKTALGASADCAGLWQIYLQLSRQESSGVETVSGQRHAFVRNRQAASGINSYTGYPG